jgi:uncharacterized protein YbjQ (UPF0145 family)
MEDFIGLAINLGIAFVLLVIGFGVGGWTERRHFRRLNERELMYKGVLITNLRSYPDSDQVSGGTLVTGECVIATDYFKSFVAKLKKIIGGELRVYLSLMDRARRESIIRLVENAKAQGCDAVCNIRYVSADVGGSTTERKAATMVAIIASGTAYRRVASTEQAESNAA